ncbi:sporulation integral membrane protein YlbJ [Paenibacillus sp. J2TS4]|uniref:sporulation integral membrane protein YlbJ n=1 Tax=Paenibacillus sp. J2TS4 TaxID=2807194 RepID=UPI001B1AB5FD|nr:sporulation integral membrane protein YlbJ [Paenibacillus sp. J2TS4]GIP31123.1 sporulation integral membrane protein YlbJ [Paenibacillus sp. J2TS4]
MSVIRSKRFFVMPVFTLAIAFLLLAYPAPTLEAAIRGVTIWWDILFPALFPFFLISEMMLGFGLVHFFGTLLDPMMRPLFRVPGIGGFVMAMGFASGYPVGARLTAQLWEQKMVNREEGERLVAFTTTSDPVFLIGAVSVGFFHDAKLAILLAAAHYGGAVLLGLFMRFHGPRQPSPSPEVNHSGRLLARALREMHRARLKDARPFGTMLQQAIRSSIQMIFVIGGLVVLFSAVMEVLRQSHALDFFYASIQALFQWLSIPAVLADSVVNGFFEVTLGAKAAGEAGGHIPLLYKAMLAAFVLSWGGLSVHGQIVSLLHTTNLRYSPFLMARLVHGLLAAGLTALLWNWLQPEAAPAFLPVLKENVSPQFLHWTWPVPLTLAVLTVLLALLSVLSLIFYRWRRTRHSTKV